MVGEHLNVAPFPKVVRGLLPQPIALIHAWVGGDCADNFCGHNLMFCRFYSLVWQFASSLVRQSVSQSVR
jgi:hypothetical protein